MPWAEKYIKNLPTFNEDGKNTRNLSYVEAVNEALKLAMDFDKNVFVLGQGVNDPKPFFGITKDLLNLFGNERIFDTPLSEDSMTGICVGASMHGARPVYLHNRPDFILLTFNQIVNHASKIHWMDNGKSRVPIVIWSAIGRGWGSGPQHSQSVHGMLLGVPGLKIIMPSNPHDAKGLMLSAIADNNPVIIIEHRWLMRSSGHVPKGFYKVPIGKANIIKKGKDLTIISSSYSLELVKKACAKIQNKINASIEIIDLRTIKPYDKKTILKSVSKTKRIMVVDYDWPMGGIASEIISFISEKIGNKLKSNPVKITLPETPVPAGFYLEKKYFFDENDIINKLIKIFE